MHRSDTLSFFFFNMGRPSGPLKASYGCGKAALILSFIFFQYFHPEAILLVDFLRKTGR